MIVKQRNAAEHPTPTDPISKAGVAAEKQLAFYLGRAFAEAEAIGVFHDLRIVDGAGEVAQVDHLVMHPCGFVVVESKSITGKVRINQHKEWTRVRPRGEVGMPDAVEQARRQRDLLRRLLTREAAGVLRSVDGFGGLGFDVLAAVSDQGVIEREVAMPKVVKADQVPTRIKQIASERKRLALEAAAKAEGAKSGVLTRDEFVAAARFISGLHRPRRAAKPDRPAKVKAATKRVAKPKAAKAAKPASPAASAPVHRCPQCGGTSIEMRWGHRPKGYYFHCLGCAKNWRGDQTCPACQEPDVPLRKSKDVMLLECAKCGHAGVFHRNGGRAI